MLPIYICEDEERQLKSVKETILKIVEEENLSGEIEIACASTSPIDILEHLKTHVQPSLYFLDVDLGEGVINGIELGSQIREIDCRGYIVMITTHLECISMIFDLLIEAMDYIIKDYFETVPERIKKCVLQAYKLYSNPDNNDQKTITLKFFGHQMIVNESDIYAVEALEGGDHRLNIHMENSKSEIRGTLKDMKSQLGKNHLQCHRSFLINKNHIKDINSTKYTIILDNGNIIPVSHRMLSNIKKEL